MEFIGAKKGNGGAKGISEALVISFFANAPGIRLDSGKEIKQIRSSWKANESEKLEAKKIWAKLTQKEKDEITEGLTPDIKAFLAKEQFKNDAWKDYQASSGKGRISYR